MARRKKSEALLHSVDDFASLMGTDRNQIEAMIKAGKIEVTMVDGIRKINARQSREYILHRKLKPIPNPKGSGRKTDKTQEDFDNTASIADADQKTRVFKGNLIELKYLKEAGNLIDREEMQKQAFQCARITRDAMFAIPARVAHEVITFSEPHDAEMFLTREITKVFEKISSQTEELAKVPTTGENKNEKT